MAATETARSMACPICGGKKFEDYRARRNERCARCKSNFRTRAAWLLLTDLCKVTPSHRIAHFAPERSIADRLIPLCGANYETYDFDPSRYSYANAKPCNLCADLKNFEQGAYDIVMHNHILEHLPCNYTMVLLGLHALLKSGGYHVFSVPISDGYSGSDMNPDLSGEEKLERFGQADHIRRFGLSDYRVELTPILEIPADYDISQYIDRNKLLAANVPAHRWQRDVFIVRKG